MPNTRKEPLYDNCIAKDINGEVIFYCSKKRANWYLNRGLADIVCAEPLVMQLNFKTNGDGHKNDEYYLQPMTNICVACGSKDNLQRHHVVPFCFRKWMKDCIKNHSYHDVVLLCHSCHDRYEIFATEKKRQIANEHNIPLDGVWLISKEDYQTQYKTILIARTLIRYADKIPDERKEYLLNKIKSNLNIETADLAAIANMSVSNAIVEPLGKIVVSRLTNIEAFIISWREHFVSIMEPRFLPPFWSITRDKR
jgi:exonuclease 3'-5' domain-containing protein 2